VSTTPTPPEPPEQTQHQAYTGLGRTPTSGAILPVPGNAEIAIWFIVEVVLAIVAAASDGFTVSEWAVATTWLTAAYIRSRGIAKASRVLEQ
jgi:hypothetical protein